MKRRRRGAELAFVRKSEVDLERRPEDLVEELAVMVAQAAEERAAEVAKKAEETQPAPPPSTPDETA